MVGGAIAVLSTAVCLALRKIDHCVESIVCGSFEQKLDTTGFSRVEVQLPPR